MHPTALVLGATGRLGHALLRAFVAAGWDVVAQGRGEPPADLPVGVLYDRSPLREPSRWAEHYPDVSVVVHAVNPPYAQWASQALPALEVAIDIARLMDARLLFPGNVYNFGEAMPEVISDDTEQRASSRKGRLRIQMEQRLEEAETLGLRSLVLRAGDFIGATRPGGWLTDGILREVDKGVLAYPGPMDLVHAWQDVDTFAATVEVIARREREFPRFARYSVPGLAITGTELLGLIEQELRTMGLADSTMPMARKAISWPLLRVIGLINAEIRELHELRSLWQQPHRLDAPGLKEILGQALPPSPDPEFIVRRALLRSEFVRSKFNTTNPSAIGAH